MIDSKKYLDIGFQFHGHKCPAMPLGLKAGSIAMNKLDVERSQAGELYTILDLGDFHCATCFADGVQVITGCTYGKGNISRSHKGKFSLTLIDQKNRKGVKVTPSGKWLKQAFQSEFMELRKKGIPPQEISSEIADPLIEKVLNISDDNFSVEIIPDINIKVPPHIWEKDLCEECGELTVAEYGHYLDGKFLCKDCAEMSEGIFGKRRGPIIIKNT